MSRLINLHLVIERAIPSALRRPIILAILQAGGVALADVLDRFETARTRRMERLAHNGQVCHLRAILARNYPGIELISTFREVRPIFAYSESLPDQMLYTAPDGSSAVPLAEREGGQAENLFIVIIPRALYDTHLEQITALVDKHKLVSKRVVYQRK